MHVGFWAAGGVRVIIVVPGHPWEEGRGWWGSRGDPVANPRSDCDFGLAPLPEDATPLPAPAACPPPAPPQKGESAGLALAPLDLGLERISFRGKLLGGTLCRFPYPSSSALDRIQQPQ